MFQVEFAPAVQVMAIVTGRLPVGNATLIVATATIETGIVVGGVPEVVAAVGTGTIRDVYALLAEVSAAVAMVAGEDVPREDVHLATVSTDDSFNTVEVTLSPGALQGVNRIMPPGRKLSRRSPVAIVDIACVLLRAVPDLAVFFPRGKWATIQALEIMCLFQYSDAYQVAKREGLL